MGAKVNFMAAEIYLSKRPLLVNALSDIVCGGCGHRIGWTGEHDSKQTELGRTDWRICNHCRPARTAIASAAEK